MTGERELKRICVFCGAKDGSQPIYKEMATALGAEMARRGIDLVYGGGNVGLMGAVATAVHENGGHVIGVIPTALRARELSGETVNVDEEIVVDTMHERKQRMVELADAFISLPGGIGTLEELAEALCWVQLGVHDKPVSVLNVNGYWAPLVEMLNRGHEQGFIRSRHASLLIDKSDVCELLDALKIWKAPASVVTWHPKPEDI
ncbi:MAG: hypothetical protein MHM6MM_009238 [Cercozoa sp. M6MM]